MSQNPFYVGGPVPPEYFIGRSSEIQTAFDQISKRAHLAIYGSSGMGKSSLLQFLASPENWKTHRRNSSDTLIVYLNCLGINPSFTPSLFWREILISLQDVAEENESLQLEINRILEEESIGKGDIRRVLRKIGRCNKCLLLLLDDYDAALQPNDQYTEAEMLAFLRDFRDLAVHDREGRYLSTVVTTFRRLSELGSKLTPNGSPWYNHYLFRLLRPLSQPEVNEQLVLPIESRLRTGVLDLVGGHPYLVQIAGYLLFQELQTAKEINLEAFIQDFFSATEQVFCHTWNSSTEEEKVLLLLIALCLLNGRISESRYAVGNLEMIFSQWRRELIDLEERGIIQSNTVDGEIKYIFSSSLMEWWVVRELEGLNHGGLGEEELKKREKVWLLLMSREQVQQVQRVITQVWQYREAVQSIATWIIGKFLGNPA